ncbi:MAG: hypothetical protein QOF96_261, partial [Actinomycetota bacterium]|nr:hypothetical protein [Actinomycetota bacterium]
AVASAAPHLRTARRAQALGLAPSAPPSSAFGVALAAAEVAS